MGAQRLDNMAKIKLGVAGGILAVAGVLIANAAGIIDLSKVFGGSAPPKVKSAEVINEKQLEKANAEVEKWEEENSSPEAIRTGS
ncbi:MAG: hypothetical protein JNM07_09405 [Phycisphaerae bacterium]|nr:hypothetical protein [Phycisphaerae bacterium]